MEEAVKQAVKTLSCFLDQMDSPPSLQRFELLDGSLQKKQLSAVETTLSFLIDLVSKTTREKRKQKQQPIKSAIFHSIDTVKVALLQMQKEATPLRHDLEKISEQYNNVIKSFRNTPKSFSGKVKYYFFKAAGWLLDKDLLESKISLPKLPKTPYTVGKLSPAFFSETVNPQEADLFHLKARTLLTEHAPVQIVNDILKSLRKMPLEASFCRESTISLKQKISYLPGEVYELTGDFSRKGTLSIPITESFILSSEAWQTGYPHPCQGVGVGLSDGILPYFLLQEYRTPKLSALIEKKAHLAETLLPKGKHNQKAKNLLALRKTIFREEKARFIPKLTELAQLFSLSPMLLEQDGYFDVLSALFYSSATKIFSAPFLEIEKLWCEGNLTKERFFEKLEAAKPSASLPPERTLEELFYSSQKCIATKLFEDRIVLPKCYVDSFSKKLFVYAATELEQFIFEMEYLSEDKKALTEWLDECLTTKIAIMQNENPPHPAIDEWLN